jgi:hypothetical protein
MSGLKFETCINGKKTLNSTKLTFSCDFVPFSQIIASFQLFNIPSVSGRDDPHSHADLTLDAIGP